MFAIEVRNTCRPGPQENHARFAHGETRSTLRQGSNAPVPATKWSDAWPQPNGATRCGCVRCVLVDRCPITSANAATPKRGLPVCPETYAHNANRIGRKSLLLGARRITSEKQHRRSRQQHHCKAVPKSM